MAFSRHANTPLKEVKEMDIDEFLADSQSLGRVLAAENSSS